MKKNMNEMSLNDLNKLWQISAHEKWKKKLVKKEGK